MAKHGFGEGLIINEGSRLSQQAALAVLRQAKRWVVERGRPYNRLNLWSGSSLARSAYRLGGVDKGHYA